MLRVPSLLLLFACLLFGSPTLSSPKGRPATNEQLETGITDLNNARFPHPTRTDIEKAQRALDRLAPLVSRIRAIEIAMAQGDLAVTGQDLGAGIQLGLAISFGFGMSFGIAPSSNLSTVFYLRFTSSVATFGESAAIPIYWRTFRGKKVLSKGTRCAKGPDVISSIFFRTRQESTSEPSEVQATYRTFYAGGHVYEKDFSNDLTVPALVIPPWLTQLGRLFNHLSTLRARVVRSLLECDFIKADQWTDQFETQLLKLEQSLSERWENNPVPDQASIPIYLQSTDELYSQNTREHFQANWWQRLKQGCAQLLGRFVQRLAE